MRSVAVEEARPSRTSRKRGVAYHFCGWNVARGESDLDAMLPGLAWYYNWSSRPLRCSDGRGVGETEALTSGRVEFVPMAWGLADGGAACDRGGPCFLVDERAGGTACPALCASAAGDSAGACYDCYHEAVTRQQFLDDVPPGAHHLLGFNEPNFKEQANLTPAAAALGWRHVTWVAEQRGLALVGPATNFCDPTPGAQHAGACIEAVDGDQMLGLAWLERFYDACSEDGVAGVDCRIDFQAVHAYSCGSVMWMLDRMKGKAGLIPVNEAHCLNGMQDADEFGVDCGGNTCVACSPHARALFARPVWLTEFATPADDCRTDDRGELVALTEGVMREVLPALEADPFVYRYAWFMPKTEIPSLDHVDLLEEDREGQRTSLGELYFGLPARTP